MYAQLKNGFINSIAHEQDEFHNIEFQIQEEDLQYFYETNGCIFTIFDGVAVLSKNIDEYRKEKTIEEQKKTLRIYRDIKCFPIINRGKLWYDTLNTTQLLELQEWYDKWLKVTETMTMPEMPEWL